MGDLKFDFKELVKFHDDLKKLDNGQIEQFMESCAKELAARLLALVIPKTPVGVYSKSTGKQGGTLRRGWTAGKQQDARAYAQSLKVNHFGNSYVIEVINPVEYASYVEYGHRQEPGRYVPAIGKRLVKGWVEGKFMLTVSEQELEAATPAILEKKLKRLMEGCFK